MAIKQIIIPNNLSDTYFDKGINTTNKIEYKLSYTVSALRAGTNLPSTVYITDTNLQGLFKYDSTDTTSADDSTYIIVDASSKRWKRTSDIVNSKLQYVTSIANLQAYTQSNLCQFDGSVWEKKAGNVASNGGSFAGTIINISTTFYWSRIFNTYINVKWFGATGLGVVDESISFNNAISYAARYQFSNGSGTIFVPKGKYLLNIGTNYSKISIIGEDENSCIFSPFNNTNPIILVTRDGGWDRMTFSKISFIGTDLTSKGVQFGNSTYVTNDEYAGRVNFDACRFVTFDKGILRMAGNIGIFINNCTFGNSNYHLWGRPNVNMQVGVTHVENSHFDNAQLASVYITSGSIGDGQFIFSSCIFEVNPGFILFVDTYKETEFVPEITFENCWNELNATATSVIIGGTTYTPQFAYLKNVSNISFINSPVSTLTLINSNCFLDRSDITNISVIKDNQSLLQIDNAILESCQTHEFVRTIKSSIRSAGAYSSYFTSYPRNTLNDVNLSNVKISIPFNTTYSFPGSSTRSTISVPNDGTTFTNCESLIINQGDTFLSGVNTTIAVSKYYVYTLAYKLISGLAPNFQLTENITISPLISLKSSKWETICGLVSTFGLTGLPATSRIYLTPATSGSSTINLGGFQLLEFDNQQDAMAFLESKTFTGLKTSLTSFGVLANSQSWSGVNTFSQLQQSTGFVLIQGTNPSIKPFVTSTNYDLSNNSGTSIIRLNDNGNVGIGTTANNGNKLQVAGSVTIAGSLNTSNNISATNYTFLDGQYIRNSNVTNGTGLLFLDATNLRIRRADNGTDLMSVLSSGNVGIGTITPASTLDITSTTSGLLIPRMTTTQRLAITGIDGLQVYDISLSKIFIHNGTSWGTVGALTGSYSATGSATTTFTVTIGSTMPNITYKVNVTPTAMLAAASFYVTNKTTTTFDVSYLTALTGAISFDYAVYR